jgi:hypothetical protein
VAARPPTTWAVDIRVPGIAIARPEFTSGAVAWAQPATRPGMNSDDGGLHWSDVTPPCAAVVPTDSRIAVRRYDYVSDDGVGIAVADTSGDEDAPYERRGSDVEGRTHSGLQPVCVRAPARRWRPPPRARWRLPGSPRKPEPREQPVGARKTIAAPELAEFLTADEGPPGQIVVTLRDDGARS